MDNQTAEKFAALFADCAVTGNSAELVKQAGIESLILPALVGAGVGGSAGYLGTQKEKNKARNAAYGALTGGLSGAGLQLFRNSFDAPAGNGGDGGTGGDGKPGILSTVGSYAAWPFRQLDSGLAAVGTGAVSNKTIGARAQSALEGVYERYTHKHRNTGEISAASAPGKVVYPGGGKTPQDTSAPMQAIREHVEQRPGTLDPKIVKKLERVFKNDSLGAPGTTWARQKNLQALNDALKAINSGGKTNAGGKTKLPQELPPNILTQLESANKGPLGRRVAGGVGRYGTNLGAGYLGGVTYDVLKRMIYNAINAPAAQK